MKNYLNNRQQLVKIDSHKSTLKNINCGVPQGSILGPLLFLIYINDLPQSLQSSIAIMYADDTNIFHSGETIQEIEASLNRELQSLTLWLRANKLSLNLSKTHLMLFSLKNSLKNTQLQIKIDNTILKTETTTRFLGVIIDNNLNWSQHIAHIANKFSKSLGLLKIASSVLNRKTLKMLYYSFLHPYLHYCILIWGNAADIHINRLTLLQKRAIRTISHADFLAHTNELFAQHKILKLVDLYKQRLAIFTFKLYKHLFPQSFTDHFLSPLIQHSHSTRSRTYQLVNIPQCRTSLKQKTLKHSSSRFHNEFLIPNDLLSLNNISNIKFKMQRHFLLTYS